MREQAADEVERLVLGGSDSVLAALEGYTKRAWVLRAWQDMFVDLVQGQLQHLFLSLLGRARTTPPIFSCFESCSSASFFQGYLLWHDRVHICPCDEVLSFPAAMGAGMLELSGLQGSSLHPPPHDGDTATIAGYKGAAAGGAWDVFARTVAPTPAAGNAEAPSHPALLLLLARVCEFLKGPALAHVTKALGATFPGQASSAGSSSQPSAFVADEIARSASSMQIYCFPANVLALLRHQALLHACTMATGTDWSCMQAAAADAGGAVGRLCGRAGPAVEQRRARSSGGCSGQRCW